MLNCFINEGMYNRIDTSLFPKKIKLVYKQIGEALQSVKLLSAAVKRFSAALSNLTRRGQTTQVTGEQ